MRIEKITEKLNEKFRYLNDLHKGQTLNYIKFAVIIPTYKDKKGKSFEYLTRSIDSVLNQKYPEFHIFVIGDKYEDLDEWNEFQKKYNWTMKTSFINLPEAKERDLYKDTNVNALWSYAGCSARNEGIKNALSYGFEYVCALDHDDYWSENHLENFVKAIIGTKADFLCSKSEYINGVILPTDTFEGNMKHFYPEPCQLIHSSTCFNAKNIKARYRDVLAETGEMGYPGDADLWMRMKWELVEKNLVSVLINHVTCFHTVEGEVKES